jgi:hypothetical protein
MGTRKVERVTLASEREARAGTEEIQKKFESYSSSYWDLGFSVKEGLARKQWWIHRPPAL